MGNKPNWGAALRTLGSGLEDIAQHKREEQLMKLVREQRQADLEAEQKAREETWQAHEAQRAATDQAQAAQRAQNAQAAEQSKRDWEYPVVNPSDYGLNVDPSLAVGPNGPEPFRMARSNLEALLMADTKPDMTEYQRQSLELERQRIAISRQNSENGIGKTPDLGGLFASVAARDPALAKAISYAGRTAELNDAATAAATTGKLQPEVVGSMAYDSFAAPPDLVNEVSGLLPEGLVAGGYVPEGRQTGPLGIDWMKKDREAKYLEDVLSASEEARMKIRNWAKSHKNITDAQIDNIVIQVSAKRKLGENGHNAVRDEIYLGRAADSLTEPTGESAPDTSSAEAELDRLQKMKG